MPSDEAIQSSVGAIAQPQGGSKPSPADEDRREGQAFLSTVVAAPGDRRLALIVAALSTVAFAAMVPFATAPLLRIDAFIPAYESALILIDAITAVMLFGQFRWSRSWGLLVLGAGYLYDALLIIPHALTFPGAFAPSGLLGAGVQTTAWLYMFWHGGFPLFLIGYSVLAEREARGYRPRSPVGDGALVGLAIAATIALAIGLSVLATHADRMLPAIMAGNVDQFMHKVVVSFVWIVGMIAVGVLWRRRRTILDLWLLVVASAWVFDVGLSAVFDRARFDLGFYAGRAYGLLAASFVLGVLLTETGGLHSRLAAAKELLDDYARRLEERVRKRTAELEAANADRQKTEAQLHQAQKMEALGQLTGGLAHDFNNHLGIIIGNLDLLGEEVPADQKELIDDARAAAFNAADLTRRLLAFARRQPLRPERLDTNQRIGDFVKLLRRILGERIDIRLNLDPSIPPILADPSQLETTIANLANNARDAMPNGGRLTITTGVRHLDEDYAADHLEVTPGAYVMIEVSDSGTGMAPETLDRVFEPFFTTKAPGKGTGLGLSMVFGFMKQSGGHINVYSELGHGTTFRLYLRPDETTLEQAEPSQPDSDELRGLGEHILVVEDNDKLRGVLVRQLNELGYRVSDAENASAALALLDGGTQYDLLLTDIVLPGKLDGYALAREFASREPTGKVLLTSGFPGARLAEVSEMNTGLRLLDKPYRKKDLALALREILAAPAPDC